MFAAYAVEAPEDRVQAGLVEPLGEPEKVTVDEKRIGVRIARVFSNQGHMLGTVMILSNLTTEVLTDRLRTSFITQMTHELRTPLTSIKGMSDVLLNLPEGRPPNRKFLEAIGRNAAILDRMIIEMLDLSEIEAENFQVRRDPIQLDVQVFAVIQGLEPRLRKADLAVTAMIVNPDHLNILGDERRLQWALGHLIENAIQYSVAGGEILIQAGRVQNGNVLIKIRDTGVGIQDKDLPHIFDRYYRGEARTAEGKVIDPRGLGQGLFIAKAVIEAHGGTIGVASVVQEGTTFTLAFPTAESG
jgi:two-component system phosphate regulon sensor histidine kinase PhoR